MGISFQIEGRPVARKDEPAADVFIAETNYFRTMGIPIIKGRDFEDRDQHNSTPVVIISEQFARQYFPVRIRWENAFTRASAPGTMKIQQQCAKSSASSGDIRNRALNTEPKPAYYMPQSQLPFYSIDRGGQRHE